MVHVIRLLMQLYYSFLFYDTATSEIYTLSLHDALPISFIYDGLGHPASASVTGIFGEPLGPVTITYAGSNGAAVARSEEHTSELQSHSDLVCRLLLEKKKNKVATTRSERADPTLKVTAT